MNQPTCEIRIPTYKRPEWLHNALNSIIMQNHNNWVAIVFDDSPEQEGKRIVDQLKDERIIYRANAKRLGASKNLNQAFQSSQIMGGDYACVLEDDNWLLPGFISANIQSLEESGLSIMHRNQEVWNRVSKVPKKTEMSTLGHRLKPGIISPCELHAGIFFFTGISNGALFWRTNLSSNLQVSEEVKDPSLQEYCRCLQICESSIFEPECYAAYAHVPRNFTYRNYTFNREFGRALQHLRRQVISYYGYEVVEQAKCIADQQGDRETLERNLLNSLHFSLKFSYLQYGSFLAAFTRAIIKYLLIKNPIHSYQFGSFSL